MKRISVSVLAVVSMVAASLLYAEDASKKAEVCKSKECAKACKDGACCKEGGCPISAAMKLLPQLTFQVGKESTCCSKSAAELAKKQDAKIQFVVAKKVFDDEAKATLALAEETEKFVATFASTKTCKVSGKTTVAGKEVCCPTSAAQTAKLVKAAMDKVNITYLVGDKECHCPNEAKALAVKTKAQTQFVVAGEKTCCSVKSRLNLARAKYKAAVEAIAATTTKEKEGDKS